MAYSLLQRRKLTGTPVAIQSRLNLAWNHLQDWNGTTVTRDVCTIGIYNNVPANATIRWWLNGTSVAVQSGTAPTPVSVATLMTTAINDASLSIVALDGGDGTLSLSGTDFTIKTDQHCYIVPTTATEYSLEALIGSAKLIADQYCNNDFELAGDEIDLTVGATYIVTDDSDPIGSHTAGSTFTATRDDTYVFTSPGQSVRQLFQWPSGGLCDLPAAIQMGVCQVASDLQNNTNGGGVPLPAGSLSSETVGSVSVSYGSGLESSATGTGYAALSAAASAFLTPYRIPPIR